MLGCYFSLIGLLSSSCCGLFGWFDLVVGYFSILFWVYLYY